MTTYRLSDPAFPREIERMGRTLDRIGKGRQTGLALSQTINKAAKKAQTLTIRRTARATKIKAKALRKRVWIGNAGGRRAHANLYISTQGIFAIDVLSPGSISSKMGTGTNRRGVRAAGKQFYGAFIQQGHGMDPSVFIRKGKKRYPLRRAIIPLGTKIVAKGKSSVRAQSYYIRYELHRNLSYRLKKELG